MHPIEKLKIEIREAIDRSGVNLASVSSLLDELVAEITSRILQGVDWAAFDAKTDAEIEREISEDPDVAPIADDAFYERAKIVQPRRGDV